MCTVSIRVGVALMFMCSIKMLNGNKEMLLCLRQMALD